MTCVTQQTESGGKNTEFPKVSEAEEEIKREAKKTSSWRSVNIPNISTWHGRLPGDRGGFLWWRWCVRT